MKKLENTVVPMQGLQIYSGDGNVDVGSKRLLCIWLLGLSYDKTKEVNPIYFDEFKLDETVEERIYQNIFWF